MTKIFIELDDVAEESILHAVKRMYYNTFNEEKLVFDYIISDASSNLENTIKIISEADEIFTNTSLSENLYTVLSSAELFEMLLKIALEKKFTNKKLYFYSTIHLIDWYKIDEQLLKGVFNKDTNNQIYVMTDDSPYIFKMIDPEDINFN